MEQDDTNSQQRPHNVDKEIALTPKKATYLKPELKIYGSVAKLTMAKGGSGIDGTMQKTASDRGVKENIVRIDTHPLGIGLYLFDYKPAYQARCGVGRQFGVMADEVETVMPEAVAIHSDGYKIVSYAMLGINRRIQ